MSFEPAKDAEMLGDLVGTAVDIESELEQLCLVLREHLTPSERVYAAEALRNLSKLKDSVFQRWEPILEARRQERKATRERRRAAVARRRERNKQANKPKMNP